MKRVHLCRNALAVFSCGALIYAAAHLPVTPSLGDPPVAKVRVVLSGETLGNLEPCGCSKPQVGGIARAAGYVKQAATGLTILKLDNGDWTKALGRQDQLKAEALNELFGRDKYAAVNLGERDWALGLDMLRSLSTTYSANFVSANVVDATGHSVFSPYRVTDLPVEEGRESKIAVTGLLSPEFASIVEAANPGLKVDSPSEVLERIAAKLRGDVACGVLLYHGSLPEAEGLLKANPWVRVAIVAHDADSPMADPIKIQSGSGEAGESWLLSVGEGGKYLVEFDLEGREQWRPARHHLQLLGPEIEEDPETRALLGRYLQKVTDENLLGSHPKQKTPNGDRYAGSQACVQCHPKAVKIWRSTQHARAFKTLVDLGHDRDPECVGCHVVGFDYESGFVDPKTTPKLIDMGCENCHLPQRKHTQLPYAYRPPKVGSTPCKQCHIPEHSPQFDFDKYWERIKH